jgi:DNA-binding GntR family transcriptional regulator
MKALEEALAGRPASAEHTEGEPGQRRAAGPPSTPDRVASAIVRGILMRKFMPGQHLTEAELTRNLGVGRSTVREAFRILSSNGVVELTPHRGAVIRTLTPADSQDLVEVMEVLAGLAARLAARRIAVGDNRARMEAVAQTLRAPHSSRQLANVLDERLDFYNVMFSIAANREVNRALPLPRAHLFRTQFHQFLTASDLRAMIGEYRGVAEAILAGDEQKAEQRMRKHVQRTGERSIPRLSQFAADPDARNGA